MNQVHNVQKVKTKFLSKNQLIFFMLLKLHYLIVPVMPTYFFHFTISSFVNVSKQLLSSLDIYK